MTVQDRLLRRSEPEPNSGCWIWIGSRDRDGYGRIRIDGKQQQVHRVAYKCFKGSALENALHTCDVPPCINPGHLFDGTVITNRADCVAKSRHARRETNGQSKLTEATVTEIRRLASTGMLQVQLASMFGVSQGLISVVVRRKAWA